MGGVQCGSQGGVSKSTQRGVIWKVFPERTTLNGLSIRDADEKLKEEGRKVLPKGSEPKTKRRWNLQRRLLPEPPVCR